MDTEEYNLKDLFYKFKPENVDESKFESLVNELHEQIEYNISIDEHEEWIKEFLTGNKDKKKLMYINLSNIQSETGFNKFKETIVLSGVAVISAYFSSQFNYTPIQIFGYMSATTFFLSGLYFMNESLNYYKQAKKNNDPSSFKLNL